MSEITSCMYRIPMIYSHRMRARGCGGLRVNAFERPVLELCPSVLRKLDPCFAGTVSIFAFSVLCYETSLVALARTMAHDLEWG